MRGALALLMLLPPCMAQADPVECTQIAGDTERLACFDRAFPPAEPAAGAGTWRLTAKPSALAEHTDHTAVLESSGLIKCRWSEQRPVRLIVSCWSNVTSVALESGCYMTSSRYRNYGDVTYSLDGGKDAVSAMVAGADNTSLGLWSGDAAIPFLKQLLRGKMLSVKMKPYADDPVSTRFDISGMAAAIAPVRRECGW